MLKKNETPTQWKWILALSAWSVFFLLPFFWSKGLGVVSKTYIEGSMRFWTGGNPYATPVIGDVFHYSPFFAALYGIFAYAPVQLHLIFWAALNSVVFFFAINQWVKWDKKMSPSIWLALAACLMELDISQRYHQINALLIGLILWAMASYRDKKMFLAGVIFALGINIKIIPIVFALPLLWPLNRRYFLGLASGLLLFFLLPVLFCGWERNLFLHKEQVMAILTDLDHRRMLDIKSVLERLGATEIATPIWKLLTCVSLVIFCGARLFFKKNFPWAHWIAFGTATLLLLSPRTESPTFVLLAASYLLCMQEGTLFEKKCITLSFFLITIVFTAVWDPFFHLQIQNNYVSKVLGTFLFWVISGTGILKRALDTPDRIAIRTSPMKKVFLTVMVLLSTQLFAHYAVFPLGLVNNATGSIYLLNTEYSGKINSVHFKNKGTKEIRIYNMQFFVDSESTLLVNETLTLAPGETVREVFSDKRVLLNSLEFLVEGETEQLEVLGIIK